MLTALRSPRCWQRWSVHNVVDYERMLVAAMTRPWTVALDDEELWTLLSALECAYRPGDDEVADRLFADLRSALHLGEVSHGH